MYFTSEIIQLYGDVLDAEERKYCVSKHKFKAGVRSINQAYARNPNWQENFTSKVIDFNDPSNRCAYLHKYAMVHTGLMCEILHIIFEQPDIYNELRRSAELKMCSLGGGPGTDIVSLLFVIQKIFKFIRCSVSVVDYSLEWKTVFQSIILHLKTGRYGDVSDIVRSWSFSYDYHDADLLNASYYQLYKVRSSIKNADIITMVKFISAAACDKTKAMIRKIFETMKPGGMLLFVDNAAGGFDSMIREVAQNCGMKTVFGPMKHYDYENPFLALNRHGYKSQFKTRVSIQMWKKPLTSCFNATDQLRNEFLYGPRRETSRPSVQGFNSSGNISVGNVQQEEPGCCSII